MELLALAGDGAARAGADAGSAAIAGMLVDPIPDERPADACRTAMLDHMGLDLSAFHMLEIKNGDWTLVPGT